MQTCRVCLVEKSKGCFSKTSSNSSGYCHECQDCAKKRHRSYSGKLLGIYRSQIASSKKRKHPPPNYSFNQFEEWAEKHAYADLHASWAASGYERYFAPSADRLDNAAPYTLDNIQLVIWKTNENNANRDRLSAKLINHHTSVSQYTKNGDFLQTYPSQAIASRVTGIPQSNIYQAINGKERRKTAGGFIWKYVI